jgi:hypothetical protein
MLFHKSTSEQEEVWKQRGIYGSYKGKQEIEISINPTNSSSLRDRTEL